MHIACVEKCHFDEHVYTCTTKTEFSNRRFFEFTQIYIIDIDKEDTKIVPGIKLVINVIQDKAVQ